MSHPNLSSRSAFSLRSSLTLAGLAIALGLGGCAITLPETRVPQSAEASAAVPPPPDDTGFSTRQRPGMSDPIQAAQTYRGVIPCADCAGQRLTVTLLPDWTYRMRRVYFGTRDNKEQSFVSTGRWERTVDDARKIRLIGDRGDSASFEFMQGSMLRMLDQNGEPIRSALNYNLTQQFETDLIPDAFTLRGRVVASGGTGTIAICSTGKRYDIASTGNPQAVVDAYSRLRVAPGTPVLMWVQGRIVNVGNPPKEQVQVDGLASGTLDSPCEP